jgi:hypothetical protein
MATNMTSPVAEVSFVDADRAVSPSGSMSFPAIVPSLLDHTSMDAVLTDIMSVTAVHLSRMTLNDKQRAILQAVANGDITTVQLLPTVVTDTDDPVAEVHPYGTVWVNTATPEVFQTPGDGTWTSIWSGV